MLIVALIAIIILILAIFLVRKLGIKKALIPIGIILILLGVIMFINRNKIDTNYYAKIENGGGELVNTTYFYWDGMSKAKYIQTTTMTESWGSTEWKEEITERGYLGFPQNIIEKSKENNSYGIVTINKDITVDGTAYQKGDVIPMEVFLTLIDIK